MVNDAGLKTDLSTDSGGNCPLLAFARGTSINWSRAYVDIALDKFKFVGLGDDFAIESCCCVNHFGVKSVEEMDLGS